MIPKLLKNFVSSQKMEDRRTEHYRNLIRVEAKIGGQIFGEVPKDHRREFFSLDDRTLIWHEEWLDASGIRRSKTTRYDVRPDGILKAQDGQPYQRVSIEEARNLYKAATLYEKRTRTELYSFIQTA
jgi:hypothetical protein